METIFETSERTVLFNIFELPFLSEDVCKDMCEKLVKARDLKPHHGSMQKYTVDATTILANELDAILKRLVPLVNQLFEDGKEYEYDLFTAHGILYSTQPNAEKKLALHVDDSDITLNITLEATNLVGSELRFVQSTEYGNSYCKKNFERMRLRVHNSYSTVLVEPKVGSCLFHRGSHPHETLPIQQGSRTALILWLKKKYENAAAKTIAKENS